MFHDFDMTEDLLVYTVHFIVSSLITYTTTSDCEMGNKMVGTC